MGQILLGSHLALSLALFDSLSSLPPFGPAPWHPPHKTAPPTALWLGRARALHQAWSERAKEASGLPPLWTRLGPRVSAVPVTHQPLGLVQAVGLLRGEV